MPPSQFRIATVMKKQKRNNVAQRIAVSVLGAAGLAGLCSCDEKAPEKESTAETAVVAETAAPAAPVAVSAEAREKLFEALLFDLGKKAGEIASHPELTEAVRNMLALTEEYYAEVAESLTGKPEKVRLALHMADITRDLTAWERACASYDRARADYDALPESVREETDVRRMLSAICNGKAFCELRRGHTAEALALYGQSLEIDSALYALVAPPDGEALPEGDVEPALARAAEDIFFSYRCLGECQEVAEDPEEARETIKSGIELAQRLDRLSPGMSLQYIRLLGALGNLESRCGNEREALRNWEQAAQMCQRLNSSTTNLSVRAKTAVTFQNLLPGIKALQEKMQAAEAATQQEQPAQQ